MGVRVVGQPVGAPDRDHHVVPQVAHGDVGGYHRVRGASAGGIVHHTGQPALLFDHGGQRRGHRVAVTDIAGHEVASPAGGGNLRGHPTALDGPPGRHPHRPTRRATGDGDTPPHATTGPGDHHHRSGPGRHHPDPARITAVATPAPPAESSMSTAPATSASAEGGAPDSRAEVVTR